MAGARYTTAGERRAADVLAFPALKAIPPPDLPLKGVAYEKYLEVAQMLLNSGKLNLHTKATIEELAYVHSEIHRKMGLGLMISAKSLERRERLMKELRLVDESDATSPQEGASSENRYANIGLILRRRA